MLLRGGHSGKGVSARCGTFWRSGGTGDVAVSVRVYERESRK